MANALLRAVVRGFIESLSDEQREALDEREAETLRDTCANFDIINRSYGPNIPRTRQEEASRIASDLAWNRVHLPDLLEARWQGNKTDAEKTIIVYAAGNDEGYPHSTGEADYPFHLAELRGHRLSVVATDPQTRAIAGFSNHCGAVPADWNDALHGPHYCLAAPGIGRGLSPNPASPGNGVDVRARRRLNSSRNPPVSEPIVTTNPLQL